jgi:hypothetical protein
MTAMPTILRPFVRRSLEVNNTINRIFNDRLGLPEGTLERLHSDEELRSLSFVKNSGRFQLTWISGH